MSKNHSPSPDQKTDFSLALIGLGVLFLIGAIWFGVSNKGSVSGSSQPNPSVFVDGSGRQVLEIRAKGGYFPKVLQAKAGQSAILKVITDNTYDCSLALSIPKLKLAKTLPITGVTEIEIPPQSQGSEIFGSCSMGMYNFKIKFI